MISLSSRSTAYFFPTGVSKYASTNSFVETLTSASAIFKEGHYLQIEVAAITANTKNPELAKKFMKFILQDEFQIIIPTTNWMFPVTEVQVPDIFKNINQPETTFLYPSIEVEKNRAEWVSEWRKALIK